MTATGRQPSSIEWMMNGSNGQTADVHFQSSTDHVKFIDSRTSVSTDSQLVRFPGLPSAPVAQVGGYNPRLPKLT
jgi:hypothetical protein